MTSFPQDDPFDLIYEQLLGGQEGAPPQTAPSQPSVGVLPAPDPFDQVYDSLISSEDDGVNYLLGGDATDGAAPRSADEYFVPTSEPGSFDPLAQLEQGEPDTPEWIQEMQRTTSPEFRQRQLQDLLKIATDEPRERKAGEAWGDFLDDPSKAVPFVGSVVEAFQLHDVWKSAKRIEEGKFTDEDIALLGKFFYDANTDPSVGAMTVDIVSQLPSFAGEIFLTGGLYTAGRVGARKAIGALLRKSIKKHMIARIGVSVAGVAGGAAVQLPAFSHRALATSIRMSLPGVGEDDAGRLALMFDEPDQDFTDAVTSHLGAAYLDTYIELFSERTGAALGLIPGAKAVSSLKTAVLSRWLRIKPGNTAADFANKIATRAGWNGALGEVFEERVGEVLRGVTGLEEFQLPSGKQLAAEAISFAIPGAAVTAAQIGSGLKVERPPEGEAAVAAPPVEQKAFEKLKAGVAEAQAEVSPVPVPAEVTGTEAAAEPTPEVVGEDIQAGSPSGVAAVADIEAPPTEITEGAAVAAVADDEVSNLIDPGKKLQAIGATGQPGFETGPGGKVRRVVRSAVDLVRGDRDSETKDQEAVYELIEDPKVRERILAAREGVSKATLADRIQGWWEELREAAGRGALPHLPRTKQYGQARSDLQLLRKSRGRAQLQTEELLARTLKPLSPQEYETFTLKVVLDDLAHEEGSLPFGYTSLEQVKADKARVDAEAASNPNVSASIEYRTEKLWPAVKADYIQAMEDVGYRAGEKLKREDYFRHQVLTYAKLRQRTIGLGRKVTVPAGRGFLKERKGSTLDISANYLQAEWEVVSQMIHDTHVARTLKSIKDKYDILDDLKAQAKEKDVEWQTLVPEDHAVYVIRPGRLLYIAHSIQESLAQGLFDSVASEIGITAEDLNTTAAIGSQFRPFVLPNPVALQLEHMTNPPIKTIFAKAQRKLLTNWKRWRLMGPTTVIKYNLRNFTEIEKIVTINPSALKKVPQAVADLVRLFKKSSEAPASVRAWAERGGILSLTRAQEIGDIDRLGRFNRFLKKKGDVTPKGVARFLPKVWHGYWDAMAIGVDFREAILRYAAYLDYTEQMKNTGKPKNYGASVPQEVQGIVDVRDRAYKLSNDLMGAYDDVTPFGQELRERWYPFWSFQETNLRAYYQAIRNMANSETVTSKVGKKIIGAAARKAPFMVLRVAGRGTVIFYGFKAATLVFNWLFFDDEEEDLPEYVRSQTHITLGRDKNGNVRYFSRIGTSTDVLEWFGADQVDVDILDVLHNRKTPAEVAKEWPLRIVNKVYSGMNPFIKGTFEVPLGQSLFPKVEQPRRIRDRWRYLFQTYGFEKEYDALSGKPGRPYLESRVGQLALYKAEPGASAYYYVIEQKYKYLRKLGKPTGYSEGGRVDALRNFKRALRFNDEVAAERYLGEYIAMGGRPAGVKQSLLRMAPLGGMTKAERAGFYDSLSADDLERLEKATNYYETTLLGNQ